MRIQKPAAKSLVALCVGQLIAAAAMAAPPIDRDSHLPLRLDQPLAKITAPTPATAVQLSVSLKDSSGTNAGAADGSRATVLQVRAQSGSEVLQGRHRVRYSLSGASPSDGEIELIDGVGEIRFVAANGVREVLWRLDGVGRQLEGQIEYDLQQRPLLAVGIVEAVVDFDRRQSGGLGRLAGLSDGLERDLRQWENRFNDGKGRIAGRTSFFAKGTVKGDASMTVMFDSEKDLRERSFTAYNPDRFYPVMGDSAERGFEARTSDRFYLRLDKERDYLLYGDFTTGAEFSLREGSGRLAPLKTVDLGQYNRSMTGLRARRDDGVGYVDAFGMRDSLRQAIEEYRGNGTSGPFAIGNFNALENSEKIEIVVRDRNNTSRILSAQALERYVDYTFEPFSGRVLLKAPLSALDADLNPVSLRITYEVDTGGEEFWVYGLNAHRRLAPGLGIGMTLVRDDNPTSPMGGGFGTLPGTGFADLRELDSINMTVGKGELSSFVLEAAQSMAVTAAGEVDGAAVRFDWTMGRPLAAPPGQRWELRLYGGTADSEFVNPAASLIAGRAEVGLRGARELGEATRVQLNGSFTQDNVTTGERAAVSVGLERDVTDRLLFDVGVRHYYVRNGGVQSLSAFSGALVLPGQGPAFGGSNLNPNGAGFWGMGVGLDPITGQPQSAFNGSPVYSTLRAPDLDVTTVSAGLRAKVTESWQLGAEVGHDQGFENDPTWFAANSDYTFGRGRAFARVEAPTGRATAGADVRVTNAISLYGRWEETNGLGSAYSIDDAVKSQAIVFGVRRSDGFGSDVRSELRMREGFNDQELEAVTGLQRSFSIGEGIQANVIAERLEILEGVSRSATALGGGLSFGDRYWQSTARLEWRRLDRDRALLVDNTADSLMSSVSFARKLGGNWTGLLRNYTLTTDDQSLVGTQLQNRFQIGAAYRPRGRNDFDMLFRFENKDERNSELVDRETRRVNILSTNANWHPNRKLWVSGRVAAKDLDERIGGVSDDYQAWLVSARIIHDIGRRFDVSVMGSMLGTPDSEAKQKAYGIEAGYRLKDNVWISAGHNFSGFSDRDLTGREQTEKGWYLRLRMKFDEQLLGRFTD